MSLWRRRKVRKNGVIWVRPLDPEILDRMPEEPSLRQTSWHEEFRKGWRQAGWKFGLTWRYAPAAFGLALLLEIGDAPYHPLLVGGVALLLILLSVWLLWRFPWREWWKGMMRQ